MSIGTGSQSTYSGSLPRVSFAVTNNTGADTTISGMTFIWGDYDVANPSQILTRWRWNGTTIDDTDDPENWSSWTYPLATIGAGTADLDFDYAFIDEAWPGIVAANSFDLYIAFANGCSLIAYHPVTYTPTVTATRTPPIVTSTLTPTAGIPLHTATPTSVPGADFVGSPLFGDAPLLVEFTHIDTSILSSCTWTFGDGISELWLPVPGTTYTSCPPAPHYYNYAGSYTVSLQVVKATNGVSNTVTKLDYIHVTDGSTPTPLPPTITPTPLQPTVTKTFTRTPTPTITRTLTTTPTPRCFDC
jgi:PKD repeat protein